MREVLRVRPLEELEGNPARLIRIPIGRHLIAIARPPETRAGLIGTLIFLDCARDVLLEESMVPDSTGREVHEVHLDGQGIRVSIDPIAKGLPDLLRLLGSHALEVERQLKRVVPPRTDLFSPVLIAQSLAIEEQEALEKLFKCRIVLRDDAAVDHAKIVR